MRDFYESGTYKKHKLMIVLKGKIIFMGVVKLRFLIKGKFRKIIYLVI